MKKFENMVRSGMSSEEVMKNGEVRPPQGELSYAIGNYAMSCWKLRHVLMMR